MYASFSTICIYYLSQTCYRHCSYFDVILHVVVVGLMNVHVRVSVCVRACARVCFLVTPLRLGPMDLDFTSWTKKLS